MKSGAQIAMAAAGGYILGRSRKAKWALLLGGVAAGRALGSSPSEILEQGTKALKSSPELSKLSGDLSGRLLDAGKGAAVRAASSQMESLTDRLNRQAETLRPSGESSHAEEPDESEPEEQPSADDADQPAAEEQPAADEQPATQEQAPPAGRSQRSTSTTKSRRPTEGQKPRSSSASRTRSTSGGQTRQGTDSQQARQAPRSQGRRSTRSTGTSARPRRGDSDG